MGLRKKSRSSTRPTNASLKKGNVVVALWRLNKWYAGVISNTAAGKVTVDFLDGRRKQYNKNNIVTKVMRMKAALPFDKRNCGPYSPDHAKLLAELRQPFWSHRTKWVAVDGGEGYWHIGRIAKLKRSTPSLCVVRFNDGDAGSYRWPIRIVFIPKANAPYVSSGYCKEAEIIQMMGESPKSPLPREIIPAPPRIGQRIIGSARKFFKGARTGTISQIRVGPNIVTITFDNGKTLGWPDAVDDICPIVDKFPKTRRQFNNEEAQNIRIKFGLKVIDPVPSLPGQRIP